MEFDFSDETVISEWARDSANKVASCGIITGYPDSSFRPKNSMTRAEAATVMFRLSKFIESR